MYKPIGITVVVLLVLALIGVFALVMYHRSQLDREARDYPPPGRIVTVHNGKMHVHAAGEGELTLVFLAGHGTSSPTLDAKPLWMRMKDEYRIAVVERFGYGWSDPSRSPRDIDTMLEQTRKALELSGEKAPYILIPHSMSGLEAMYWAQTYPDEVKAVIGLDPCTPEAIDTLPSVQNAQVYALYAVSRMGLSRFMPESDREKTLPLMASSDFTKEDKLQYMAMFYKSSVTRDMVRELSYLTQHAQTVKDKGIPVDTPMCFFISRDQEASAPGWGNALTTYLSQLTIGIYHELEASHYVHHEKAEKIALEAKAFLKQIQ